MKNCAMCNQPLQTPGDIELGVHMGFCPEPGSPQAPQPVSLETPAEAPAAIEPAAEEQDESEAA